MLSSFDSVAAAAGCSGEEEEGVVMFSSAFLSGVNDITMGRCRCLHISLPLRHCSTTICSGLQLHSEGQLDFMRLCRVVYVEGSTRGSSAECSGDDLTEMSERVLSVNEGSDPERQLQKVKE